MIRFYVDLSVGFIRPSEPRAGVLVVDQDENSALCFPSGTVERYMPGMWSWECAEKRLANSDWVQIYQPKWIKLDATGGL